MKQSKVIKVPRHTETLTYRVVITDKDGKVLHDISAPSKSFVCQWNQIINGKARDTDVQVTDTSGVARTCSQVQNAANLVINATIGTDSYGLRVGKGTTAVAIDDYALETPCDEGVGVDQLNHQLTELTAPQTVGSTCSFTVRRAMINNSGATIVGVQELGAYLMFRESTTARFAMGFRDILGSAVDVPDGGAVTVEYTIGVTV